MMLRNRLPLWLKFAYLLWMGIWVPVYWLHHGPANFLWLCDVANFFVAIGLLWESPVILSSQAVGVLVIQIVWMVDYFGRLALGLHLIGGTEYMFEASQPWWLRAMSLFHIFVPALLIWPIWCLGYDRRGWQLEAALAWLILPLSFVIGLPEDNLNWLWAPFGIEQTLMTPEQYLLFCMLAYPVLLFWPPHRLLLWWSTRQGVPIQPLYLGHVDWYVDYSHGTRLVRDQMTVDGATASVKEILNHPELHVLLTDEGPFDYRRQ